MPDPRRFDLVIRSVTTALIASVVTVLAGYQAIHEGKVSPELAAWGGIIIGVYFGSHTSLNGSGVRAARDQALTRELLEAAPPQPPSAAHDPAVRKADD